MRIIHGSGRRMARMCRRLIRLSLPFRERARTADPGLAHWERVSTADWTRDIFLSYPTPSAVVNAPTQYQAIHDFYHSNKKVQREKLAEHFLVPQIGKPPYVVRPLRHERGEGFEVVTTLPAKTKETTHYWSSLWHRSSEYRVFFVRGEKVLTLLKRVPEGTRQDIPWSHGVSSFVTVHDETHDRLRHTKFYEKAAQFLAAYPFQFLCVDVLYHACSHRVVEVNFSPNITISENLNTLAEKLSAPFLHDSRTVRSIPSSRASSANVHT